MADQKKEVRIDKWLWAVRIYKTRTIATEACKKGRVSIANVSVKPSRMVKIGDVVNVRKPPIQFTFEVLDLSEQRMGAKLVPDFMKDLTPESQLDILKAARMRGFIDRERGQGRPTKKERRDLDDFSEDFFSQDDWDWDED